MTPIKCSCGKLHRSIPKNARVQAMGDDLDGYYWECKCKSTLFQPDPNLYLADVFKQARLCLGLTQTQMARTIQSSQSRVSKMEIGLPPSGKDLMTLFQLLSDRAAQLKWPYPTVEPLRIQIERMLAQMIKHRCSICGKVFFNELEENFICSRKCIDKAAEKAKESKVKAEEAAAAYFKKTTGPKRG